MAVLQILLLFVYMCLMPYLTGYLLVGTASVKNRAGVWFTTAAGLMVSYALYEILTLSFQRMGYGFRAVSYTYFALSVLLTLGGLGCVLYTKRRDGQAITGTLKARAGAARKTKPNVYMIAAFILIAVQIGAVLFMATPDKDDAFYSGLSSMSLAYDYLLEFNAYGGRMASEISKRYMVSALPIYQASLSLFSGLHHLVITHNLFPVFYIPLVYGLYDKLGTEILSEEKLPNARGKFLFAFAFLHLIGNYYVFSPENFLVTRLWQGKALFVAIGVPMLWMCGQKVLYANTKSDSGKGIWKDWLLVACVLVACCFMGETGLFLAPFMFGCQTLSVCIVTKRWKKMIPAILCCVPEAILFFVYLR